jgi:poly(A) polymerase
MKFNYHPKNKLEKFGVKVYNLLVDNFPQTFFVGGMVRDSLLNKTITDVDLATEATPEQILKILLPPGILADDKHKNFGTITAKQGNLAVEITTFRKDLKSAGRYNKVRFIKSAKIDSQRRDFTVNSLYLSLKNKEIKDYVCGVADIQAKQINFIGKAENRIKQDPLRIIRALRFCLALNFTLENKTKSVIKNNFSLLEQLTKTKIKKEIIKLKSGVDKKILEKVINNPKLLDKYFK